MLVPSMTLPEVYKEITGDFDYVNRKASLQAKMWQKEMLRKGLAQQTFSTVYKTSRRNEWNVISKITKQYMKTSFYIKSADKVGMVAYSLLFQEMEAGDTELYLLKYCKHFFDRYNERMALGFNETSKTLKYFFKNNFDFTMGVTDVIEEGICASTFVYKDGIGVSWKNVEAKTFHIKTFVSADMFTHGQKELANGLINDDSCSHVIKLKHLRKAV